MSALEALMREKPEYYTQAESKKVWKDIKGYRKDGAVFFVNNSGVDPNMYALGFDECPKEEDASWSPLTERGGYVYAMVGIPNG